MKPHEHDRMRDAEDSYWWFVARREAAVAFARDAWPAKRPLRVLDVGCGTGGLLASLAQEDRVSGFGLDWSMTALSHTRQRGLPKLARGDMARLPFATNSLDGLFALDVLEHVPDDARATAEFARVLKPGGILVASVPAFRFLWSEHDIALDHFRRYTRGGLKQVLRGAGLEITKATYLLSALFPAVVAHRLVAKRRPAEEKPQALLVPVSSAINRALVQLQRAELAIARRLALPFGSSVLIVARKPHPTVP